MSKKNDTSLPESEQVVEQGVSAFSIVGLLSFLGSRESGERTYFNFKVGNYPFSMSGKSGEWAKQHDMRVCVVSGSMYPQDTGFSVKLYANNVSPCIRYSREE